MGSLPQASPRILASLALILAACNAAAGEPSSPPPRNLLLVTLDTTRADRLGCYGSRTASTPHLDGLARRGVRFAQVVSPAPLTAPAHASLMTGRVPRRHGVRDNTLYPLDASVPVLSEILAGRGYATGAAVSAAVLDRAAGLGRGFDWYDDSVRVGRREAFNYEERAATQTNDAVARRLGSLDAPFFLWVHYFDPHLPYVPPPPFDTRFATRPYDGEIAFMDHALGQLLEQLKPHLQNTLVVVAGDHGESLEEHGEAAHGVFLYQSTQRVPLLFLGTGLPAGKVIERTVGLIDVMPTILSLLEIAPIPDLDGRSLRGLIDETGADPFVDRAYEMESWFPHLAYGWEPLRGLVVGPRVLIDAPRPELYDLADDPGQRRNLGTDGPVGRAMMATLEELVENDRLAAVKTDPETAERAMRLRSLGYVGGLAEPASGDAIDPKDGIRGLAVLERARRSVQTGNPGEAIEPLEQLLKWNPSNVPAWLTLAAARLATGQAAAAVAAARRAVGLRPRDDLAGFNLANALSAEGATRPAATAEARARYEETLRLNPRRAEAYLNYAELLIRSGQTSEVRALLDRAAQADVQDPDLYVERAVLELSAGNVESAVKQFEDSLRLDPYDTGVLEALTRIAARRGRREEAAGWLERWLELLSPDAPERGRLEDELRLLRSNEP